MSGIPTVLKKIVARKIDEIAERSTNVSIGQLEQRIAKLKRSQDPRGFAASMQRSIGRGHAAVIGEAKKRSPSKGLLRENFIPSAIAASYQTAGASCVSVLTDADFFEGCEQYLIEARAACDLPVIRKDFIIDPYQVFEARAIGADCVLLIVSCLEQQMMIELNNIAQRLGMDVLIEVHGGEELEQALSLDNKMLGINNRNLHTFEVSLDNTFDLLKDIPKDKIIITESAIHTRDDVAAMRDKDVNGFLVGEAFMRADDPGSKLKELFF